LTGKVKSAEEKLITMAKSATAGEKELAKKISWPLKGRHKPVKIKPRADRNKNRHEAKHQRPQKTSSKARTKEGWKQKKHQSSKSRQLKRD
jgi:hypothetical protein